MRLTARMAFAFSIVMTLTANIAFAEPEFLEAKQPVYPTVPVNLSIQSQPSHQDAELVDTSESSSFHNKYGQYLTNYIQNYNKRLTWDQASLISQSILRFSQRYNVDFRLITGLIAIESSFRSDVVSSSGAIGLGQLKPATAKWMGVVNPYDPVDNIAGTTRFLSWLLKKYDGSLDHALSAYYQGPGHVDRNGITPNCEPYLQKMNRVLATMI